MRRAVEARHLIGSVRTIVQRNTDLLRRLHYGQVLLALLAGALLDVVLSNALTWYKLLPGYEPDNGSAELNLTVPIMLAVLSLTWLFNKQRVWRVAEFVYAAIVTADLLISVGGVIFTMGGRKGNEGGLQLLGDTVLVWLTNIFVFALWYWLLDSGGPMHRDSEAPGTPRPDFVFPQQANSIPGWNKWQPQFVDYLFLAFNTSTSFSPTDTLVLARWGKLLMMAQALMSLVILAVLAARAINILGQ